MDLEAQILEVIRNLRDSGRPLFGSVGVIAAACTRTNISLAPIFGCARLRFRSTMMMDPNGNGPHRSLISLILFAVAKSGATLRVIAAHSGEPSIAHAPLKESVRTE